MNKNISIRASFFLILIYILSSNILAQSIPLGMPFFDDALRRSQLMGLVNEDVSYMIRPVHPKLAFGIENPNGNDSLINPNDTNRHLKFTDTKLLNNKIRISLLPIYTHVRRNGHHPYGWADGPMIPAKGLQQYISAGLYAKAGPLELQFRPEIVRAQNKEFQNPPFRAREIDFPERMGQDPYSKNFLGQSFAKLNFGPVTVGY